VDAVGAYAWLRTAPDFSVAASPASARVTAGGSAAYAVTVASRNGFAAGVALSVAGLPAGATATFSPATVPGGSGTAQLAVVTAATVTPGSYPLTIAAASGTLVRTTAVTLEVAGPPEFTLATTPGAASVRPGESASFTLTVGALNGFAAPVTFSATGLPGSTRATFTPSSSSAPGTAKLTLATAGGTRRASYTVTVVGTSGGLRHTTPIALTVR
jgi:hypothetical protein